MAPTHTFTEKSTFRRAVTVQHVCKLDYNLPINRVACQGIYLLFDQPYNQFGYIYFLQVGEWWNCFEKYYFKKFKDHRVLPSYKSAIETNHKQQIHIKSFNHMLYLNRLMNFKGINNLWTLMITDHKTIFLKQHNKETSNL